MAYIAHRLGTTRDRDILSCCISQSLPEPDLETACSVPIPLPIVTWSQRETEIITRDFSAVAVGSSSISKELFSQLLELHLVRQPTPAEVAFVARHFGETGLQLADWLQWVHPAAPAKRTARTGRDCSVANGLPNQKVTSTPPKLEDLIKALRHKAKLLSLLHGKCNTDVLRQEDDHETTCKNVQS